MIIFKSSNRGEWLNSRLRMRNIPWKITEKRNVCKLTTCTCNPFYRTLYGVNHLKYYLELNGGCHISSMIASMCVPSGFIVTFFKLAIISIS